MAILPSLIAHLPADRERLQDLPDCAEDVRAAARKCRFCGYLFTRTPATQGYPFVARPRIVDEARHMARLWLTARRRPDSIRPRLGHVK